MFRQFKKRWSKQKRKSKKNAAEIQILYQELMIGDGDKKAIVEQIKSANKEVHATKDAITSMLDSVKLKVFE